MLASVERPQIVEKGHMRQISFEELYANYYVP